MTPETKEGSVTATRYFSRKLSASRNADRNRIDPRHLCDSTPDACHWCRDPFKPGQVRSLVLTGVWHSGGWGIASVCMECFEYEKDQKNKSSITQLERINTECDGCGEPIQTVTGAYRGHWNVCSNRCYQRAYRKRRRGVKSVVPWKSREPNCEACKRPFTPSRRDARFCSNRCRQWHYRRRKRAGAP